MYVLVDRPRLLNDLQAFLRGRGFIAAQRRGDGLDVSIPGDADRAQARRVVSVYLTVWQAVHPGVQASIVENDRAPRTFSVSALGLPLEQPSADGAEELERGGDPAPAQTPASYRNPAMPGGLG